MSNAASEPAGNPERPKKRARRTSRNRGESIYLGALVAISFLVAVAFLLLTAWSIFIPAAGISFLFGIVVATLAYAFLGSKGHDNLNIRGVQLGGAAAVVAGFVLLANIPLERQIAVLERLEELSRNLQAAEHRARAAEERANRELVVQRGVPQRIVGGGRIRLEDVNTLNGWREGPHAENQRRTDRDFIFRRLFQRLDIQRPVAEVLDMTEQQWQGFLTDLPEGKRLQLGGIPFATLTVQASDGLVRRITAFKNDANLPVANRRNQTEAFLCIRRVLDVRERRSDEPEIIVLTHSSDRCQ